MFIIKLFVSHGTCYFTANFYFSYYVIRQLKETVGESYIKDLINTNLSFMIPRNVRDFFASFNVADIFNIFAGEEYQHAKDMVNNVIGCDESRESLNQALKKFEQVRNAFSKAVFQTFYIIKQLN